MRIMLALPIAAILLALGACKQEPDKPKQADEVKAEAAKLTRPEPGLYKSTMRLGKLEIPGMPADKLEAFKGMMTSTARSREFCLTKAESEQGFEEFGKKLAQGKCSYDRFNATSTTLDAKLTCQTGEKAVSTVELNGTMSASASQMTMKLHSSSPQMPGSEMVMEAEVTSERIGDCPGGKS